MPLFEESKKLNKSQKIRLVLLEGPATNLDIREETGLAEKSIRTKLSQLMEKGHVIRASWVPNSGNGGCPYALYAITPRGAKVSRTK